MLALVVDTSTHPRAAHPRAMCYKCYNESIPLHTRLTLNELQASCYSHHRSQFALSETNWLLRVLGCNPYLESLPNYYDGAPPWTPTNMGHRITSRPLKHDPEIPPRDLRNYALTTDQSCSINQVMFTIQNISCQPLQPILIHNQMLNPYQLILPKQWIYICISYQYHVSLIPTISFKSHANFIPTPSSTIHE